MGTLLVDTPLSIGGLTSYIQDLLEQDDRLRQVWVTGEVSSARQYPSGLYFTLQDPKGDASMRCVAWSRSVSKLAVLPVVGEQLIVLGTISLYPKRGEYQLNIWQALPAGEGLQALRLRQLRDRLETEGLFDEARKRTLPIHPQTIAVVTSPQAAAWGDIQRTLGQRYPGLHVLFSPAIVQGEQAPDSIAAAIDRVVRDGRAEVLILARGGGAVEELACFNDERVVRAIASCPIPVITGIGHQRDESLADLVADFCAHTPTAAAERVVPELASLYTEHLSRLDALNDAVYERLKTSEDKLERLRSRLQRLPLDRQIQREIQKIGDIRQYLHRATSRRLEQATGNVQLLKEKLATLDPNSVLKRGYAVVREEKGAIARSSANLTIGQEVHIQLGEGGLKATITEIIDKE
jgi:exodeoxyribonuclease VII large subunit